MMGRALAALAACVAWSQVAHHASHKMNEVPGDRPSPSVEVRITRDGPDGYNLQLITRNFKFTPHRVNTENVPNEGHAHLYVNGEKVARLYSEWRHMPARMFREGLNRVRVELNGNDHSPWALAGEPLAGEVLLDTRSQDDPIRRMKVHYRLTWDSSGAERLDRGWAVRNNLGYRVRVESGRLVTRSIELSDCHATTTASVIFAYAGHGLLVPDASKTSAPHVEDLATTANGDVEQRTVTTPEYCQGYYLIGYPPGPDLNAPSLEVAGVWTKGDESRPFRIRTRFSYGLMKDLPGDRAIGQNLDVRIERRLVGMFDGVDFAAMDEAAQGRQIVRSIVDGYRFRLGSGS